MSAADCAAPTALWLIVARSILLGVFGGMIAAAFWHWWEASR